MRILQDTTAPAKAGGRKKAALKNDSAAAKKNSAASEDAEPAKDDSEEKDTLVVPTPSIFGRRSRSKSATPAVETKED
jgi:hypothetical protein